jgi:3-oxoadipate enol-lactonase
MDYQIIGKGEPIVFIHGLGQTQKAWELQKELADQFQLFIPTLRGHGESLVTEDMTLDYFAEDILKMLDDKQIESAHFCGLSLGGVIVQEIYKQSPKRVRSMILANTTSYVPSFALDLAVKVRERSLNQLSDEQYITQTAGDTLYKPTDQELHQAVKSFHMNRDTYVQSSRAIRGVNYLPYLGSSTPIHIIASSNDNVTPYLYNARFTKMWARGAKITVLNKAGHLSNIQKPVQFNQIVRDFVGAS